MTKCRYDREAGEYLADGEPCKTDDYGDPTKHCTARRSCSVHVGADELTCPRCIARTRAMLRRIPVLTELMTPVAVTSGVESAAASLAGPATQPGPWIERRIAMRRHLATWEALDRISESQHLHARQVMDESDDRHPLNVLGDWDLMIREDYDHPSNERVTVSNAAAYLDRMLHRIANDPEQDFPLFATEIRKCLRHLEAVAALAVRSERGAPCPECVANEDGVPRLVRHYGHWCEDPTCEKVHYDQRWDREIERYVPDPSGDTWVCPRCQTEWEHEQYERYVEERRQVGA